MAEEVVGRGLLEILPDFRKFGKELATSMRTARAQLDGSAAGLRASAGTIFNSMAKVGKGTTLIGVGVAAASVKMAGDFQAETAVLQTAAGETASGLKTVRAGILNLSKGTGTGLQNLTDGMYTVEKAGYRGSKGLMVLKAAAQGAKEENAKLSDVTNAMTSVMASYHLKATDSTRVMNALKTAAGEGKITMEEFSGALSTVLPIASANKISFAEVAGAVATLTQHGTSAREATHELSATIRALAAPNNVAVKEMARFGLTAQDVSLNLGKKGLTGTIDLLVQSVLTKMGPSGKVLLSSFNDTKQAAAAAQVMLSKMAPATQKVAKEFLAGKIASADWKDDLKGMPVAQANLAKQFATLVDKNRGFSDELKKGGPATKTFTEAIKKMSGGAIGLNTVLQLSGESQAGFEDRVKKVGKSYNNASKDVEGWKVTQGLFNNQLDRMKQTAQVLMIQLGTKLIPVLQRMVTWMSNNQDVVIGVAGAIAGVLTLAVAAFAAKTVVSAGKVILSFGKIGLSAGKMGVNLVRGLTSASAAASSSTGLAGTLGGAIRKGLSPSTYVSAFTTLRLRGMYAVDAVKTGLRSVGTTAATMAGSIKSAAVSAGTSAWSGITTGLSAVGRGMKTAALATKSFTVAMYESAVANARAALAWAAARVKTLAQAAATGIATAAQWLWNAAMDANPITLIIIGIAALVAAVVLIATKTTWFQDLWHAAWNGIQAAFAFTWNFIKDHWRLLVGIITGPIGIATIFVIDHWHQITGAATAAWSWVKDHWPILLSVITGPVGAATIYVVRHWDQIKSGAKSALDNTISFFSGLPSRVVTAVGKLGDTLKSKGGDLIGGLISGAKAALTSGVGNFAKTIKDKIVGAVQDVFDMHSPSRVMMTLGGHMMSGLFHGILRGKAVLHSLVKSVFHSPLDAAKTLLANGVKLPGKWLNQLIGSGSMKGNAPLGKGVQDAQNYAAELVSEIWPSDFATQMGSLKMLWENESGWRWNAKNPVSGAYGIPQSLPASKMAAAGSDWMTNPRTQIIWGLNYIRNKYGRPSSALGSWMGRNPHWYDSGGLLPPGLSLVMNGTGRPETIRNQRQEAALAGRGSNVVINLTVVNKGVIGNKQDAVDFLVEALDLMRRQGKLPAALGGR